MTHPPKQKHANKPRATAPVRLTREQQVAKAGAEMAKARMHLAESEVIGGKAPNAAVHSAYYAMHHCAIAVLLVHGGVDRFGDVPGSHQHVVEHFAKLADRQGDDLRDLGRVFARALSDRMKADYDLARSATAQDAAEITKDARHFTELCGAKLMQGLHI